jgi:Protein of unknown function (DUF2380)
MRPLLAAIFAILLLPGPSDAEDAPRRVAVFDVEFWDTSGEGESPEQTARLAMLGALLRDRLAESSGYAVVDLAPVRPEIEASLPLFRCGGCQLEIAQDEHADPGDRAHSCGCGEGRGGGFRIGFDPQQQRRRLASGSALPPRAPVAGFRCVLKVSKHPRRDDVGVVGGRSLGPAEGTLRQACAVSAGKPRVTALAAWQECNAPRRIQAGKTVVDLSRRADLRSRQFITLREPASCYGCVLS